MHTGSLNRRIDALEEQLSTTDEPWCPGCGHGLKLVILKEGEPEPICKVCGRPESRNPNGIRLMICKDTDEERENIA